MVSANDQSSRRALVKIVKRTRTNFSDSSRTHCKIRPCAVYRSESTAKEPASTATIDLTYRDLPAKVKHTTWVYQTWGGEVRSRVVCSKCKKPSDTLDNFLDLSLDVPKGPRSITTMLQGFIKEDRLEGDNKYHCEK